MTLFNRLHGDECRKDEFSPLQRLSQTQENQLTEWVLLQDALGLPPHTRRSSSSRSASSPSEATTSLSENIECKTLARNPAIRTQKCHQRDSARANGASTEVIGLGSTTSPSLAFRPLNRAQVQHGTSRHHGRTRGQWPSGRQCTPGSRAWTSFVECVSATGTFHLPTSSRHFQEEIRPARQ